jgi:demethylmenaquinone methyltransferase/2-methoxy-6-polyprenyl-1,4-benzoquinol methylase
MTVPDLPIRNYFETTTERSLLVREIFNRTAGDYDRLERVLGLGTGSWYRRRALRRAGLKPGMSVLDIGTGTGLLAREAAAIVGNAQMVVGVDPSPGMMEHAKVPPGLRLLAGSAEAIPATDDAADFLSVGYVLRYVGDLPAAFLEFFRVLRPGGRLCLLELTQPSGSVSQALLKVYLHGFVTPVASMISRHRDMRELMPYFWDTIEACAPPAAIISALTVAGFVDVDRILELGIFSEYRARKPA